MRCGSPGFSRRSTGTQEYKAGQEIVCAPNDREGTTQVLVANDPILWNLEETARQLGNVSVRTVQRLIVAKKLPVVKIGNSPKVPAAVVRAWVDAKKEKADNPGCELDVRTGGTTCHLDGLTARSGGYRSPHQMARELDVLLGQHPKRKRKR